MQYIVLPSFFINILIMPSKKIGSKLKINQGLLKSTTNELKNDIFNAVASETTVRMSEVSAPLDTNFDFDVQEQNSSDNYQILTGPIATGNIRNPSPAARTNADLWRGLDEGIQRFYLVGHIQGFGLETFADSLFTRNVDYDRNQVVYIGPNRLPAVHPRNWSNLILLESEPEINTKFVNALTKAMNRIERG